MYISELLLHVNAKSTAGSRLAPLGPSHQRNPGDPSYTLDVSPRYFDGAWSSHAQTRRHRPLSHRAILLTRGVPTTFPGHGPDRSCSVPDPQAVRTLDRPLMPWDWLGAGCNRYIAELLSGDNAKSTACSSPAPTLTSYQLPSVYRGSLRPSVTEYRPGIVRSASYRPETDTSPKYFERRTRTHRWLPSSAYADVVPASIGI